VYTVNAASLFVAVCAAALAGCTGRPAPDPGADAARLNQLKARVEALEQRKSLLEDANAVKRLQRAYGYYVDKGLWDEAADLFADDGTLEIGLDGVYVGKARVREYLRTLGDGREGLAEGRLNEHLQVMPVIDVAPDGKTAEGRWRDIILAGTLGGDAFWGEGPQENEYVKDGGVWKIEKLHWYDSMYVPYATGWQTTPDPTGGKFVADKLPPDAPPTVQYKTWPDVYLPPFHFPNPVGTYVPSDSGGQ
jgi:hypothetical protein